MDIRTYYFHCDVYILVVFKWHLIATVQFKAHKMEIWALYLLHATFSDPRIKCFRIRMLYIHFVYEFCCYSGRFCKLHSLRFEFRSVHGCPVTCVCYWLWLVSENERVRVWNSRVMLNTTANKGKTFNWKTENSTQLIFDSSSCSTYSLNPMLKSH